MKAAIFAIGTEVTSGEIINTNGAWLAERLESLGFEVLIHMAVPDEASLMIDGLNWCADKVDLIFTSGGLGPTTDDFTRNIISEWADAPLEFRQDLWNDLETTYQQRGLVVREAHKNQCWFPKGSEILKNHVGSAHGFRLNAQKKSVFILPGPPSEIKGMWEKEIVPLLKQLSAKKNSQLHRWVCLGTTESEIAEKTEEIFKDSGVLLGYRANIPYVHVKAWISDEFRQKIYVERLEKTLAPYVVSKGLRDPILNWLEVLQPAQGPFAILDYLSKGHLNSRLAEIQKEISLSGVVIDFSALAQSQDKSADIQWAQEKAKTIFLLESTPDGFGFVAQIQKPDGKISQTVQLPYKLESQSQRGRLYCVELAFHKWAEMLGDQH